MASNKKVFERVAAVKRTKATGDYSQLTLFLRELTSEYEIDTVREQKLLFGLPQPLFDECLRLFCHAAERVLDRQEAIYAINYSHFVQQASSLRERIDQQFQAGLSDVNAFTLGDIMVALDTWLQESFAHISAQAWDHSKAALNQVETPVPMRAALSEETYQSVIGNTNEIAFAAARLLNEVAARFGCSPQSSVRSKHRERLSQALPDLIFMAHTWNGIQHTIDKVSYGEWRVLSIDSQDCKFGIIDVRLEISRVLALRREAIQRMKRLREGDSDSTFIGKQLGELLPHFLGALLDDVPATYDLDLTTQEYWDLRNQLKRRLSDVDEEDDLILLATRDDGQLMLSDYIACAILRWHGEVSQWLSKHISKRKQRAAQWSPLSIASLVQLLPVSAEDRMNVRRSLEVFCAPPPRNSFYSILDSPFFLLKDESIAAIPVLEAERWTAAVRSRWIRKGNIGHHYGHRWEEYLIWLLDRKGWTVLARNINLKHKDMGHCEIDLLLGRDDVCLVIQMKAFAGQGTDMYDHWKNRQTIEKGISQAKLSVKLLTSTYRLSDLVGKTAAKSIRILRPVVLSTLHYFNGWKSDGVTVLSVGALIHLMRGAPVDFWTSSGKVSHDSVENPSEQLTGTEVLEFLDNPVDWRISQETAVINEKPVMIEEVRWSVPYVGTDGDPFELHPSV